MLKGTKYRLIVWLLVLGASAAASSWLLHTHPLWLIATGLTAALSIVQIVSLFSGSLRKTSFMLDAVANGDYAFRFTERIGTSGDRLLNMTLNRIKEILLQEKAQVARQEAYYSLILGSVNTGILVMNTAGAIHQTNDEAMRQLRLSVLTHINQLARIDESLPAVLMQMQPGERRSITFHDERGEVRIAIRCAPIILKEKQLRIFALNEITGELVEQELESWVRLIRVLTHEIMNSITPITSLSETLIPLAGAGTPMREGLETIRATGRGLSAFVDSYRQLTRLPTPRPTLIEVRPFLQRVVQLFPGVRIELSVEPDELMLHTDESLLQQVVVNLLTNAAQAIEGREDGRIAIEASCSVGEQVCISVGDNGPGIAAEVLPNIFIPFFTTKQQGSGIGLSLSRQIMRLLGGTIGVQSQAGDTTFVLVFP